MAQSNVFAGVGGYYGGNQGNLAGVFRRDADGNAWQHVLIEPEAYTVFVHPRDPSLVLAGTKDGIYRSTDRGATFKRANFPDAAMQVWSFLPDPADDKRILAGRDLSLNRCRRELDPAGRSEAAGPRQGAVRLPRHALCAASAPAERDLRGP